MQEIDQYSIFLNIDSDKHEFSGTLNITGKCDGNRLELDLVDLQIMSVKVNEKDVIPDITIPKKILLDVPKGTFHMEIRYNGNISKILTGFYIASYKGGEMFTTQFESTDARRMFPCIDHPNYKARFQLSVEINSNLDAISNTPITGVVKNGNRKTVSFEVTPRMSTYLLYLGIGHLRTRSRNEDRIEIALVAPDGLLTESDFPLDIASRVMGLLQSYFEILYPLPKLQLIYVPEFSAGAMENWGAITFRDYYLSIDQFTSAANYKAIANVIAHELVHQWFGNLVTMEWWNDLWLNESFATFLSYKMIEKIYPEWNPVTEQFVRTGMAFFNDSLKNTHPIEVTVDNPEQISQIFDNISYGKGAAILRMIETYLGEINFRNGLRKYLGSNMYMNARGEELWKSLEIESKLPVTNIMSRWIMKPGYPIVQVTRQGEKIRLEQQRFKLDGLEEDLWPIPISIHTSLDNKTHLMEKQNEQIEFSDLVSLNRKGAGFYRVLYHGTLLSDILRNSKKMDMYEKWSLINDYYAFLSASLIDFTEYMDVLNTFKSDMEPFVIREMVSQIQKIFYIRGSGGKFGTFSLDYLTYAADFLGERKDGESPDISIARGSVAFARAVMDRKYCDELCHRIDNIKKMDPDMRGACFVAFAILRGDSVKHHAELMKLYNEVTVEEDRLKIISALGWMQTEEALERVLKSIGNGEIKKQNIIRFLNSCAHNSKGRQFLAKHMVEMVNQLRVIYSGSRYTSAFIEESLPYLSLNGDNKMIDAMESISGDDIVNGIERAKEIIRINTRLTSKIH